MSRGVLWPAVLGLAFFTVAEGEETAGSAFRQPRFEVRKTAAIVYGRGAVRAPQPGKKDLLLDLYEPTGAGVPAQHPAAVLIHGGGFKGGSRTSGMIAQLCQELTTRGFVCVSIDYRMQGDDPPTEGATLIERAIRAAINDAGTATKWLIDHADEYQIDTSRIAVGGGSAGAITSLMLAYKTPPEGVEKPKIAAVIDLWGSLYQSVNDIDAGEPPVLIIHGTQDQVVKYSGAEDIVRRCKAVGVTCELYAIEGAGHGVPLGREYEGVALNQRIADFLLTHLKLGELAE
jgi:acetyl esterase/lipase